MTQPLPQVVKDFIAGARVCRIATVRPNGEPHVIAVCPVFDGESTVYVDIGRDYVTAKNVEGERRGTVLIDEYSEDWDQLKGVVLRCEAEPVSGAERDAAWRIVELCVEAGLVDGEELYFDATRVEANASTRSLRPRLSLVAAREHIQKIFTENLLPQEYAQAAASPDDAENDDAKGKMPSPKPQRLRRSED